MSALITSGTQSDPSLPFRSSKQVPVFGQSLNPIPSLLNWKYPLGDPVQRPFIPPDLPSAARPLSPTSVANTSIEDYSPPYSLMSVEIPGNAFLGLISSDDVDEDNQSLTSGSDSDETVVATNKLDAKPPFDPSETDPMDFTSPRAQYNSGAKATVTNLLYLLRNVHFFSEKSQCPVRMYGATDDTLFITPTAVGNLRIPAINAVGYVDVRCYYSHSFSSTLLSDSDIIRCTGTHQDYSGQSTDKFFDESDKMQSDLAKGIFSLDKHYNVDTGYCMVTCHHKRTRRKNIILPGIIRYGQCFSSPIVIPALPTDHPLATSQHFINQAKSNDPSFKKLCKQATLRAVYEHQEDQFRKLQAQLEFVPAKLHSAPMHNLIYAYTPINAIKTKTERRLSSTVIFRNIDAS